MKEKIFDFLYASGGCYFGLQIIPDDVILSGAKSFFACFLTIIVVILCRKINTKKSEKRLPDTV